MIKKQLPLFPSLQVESVECEEWSGMPEFIQEEQKPYAKIIVRFENDHDLKEFEAMIGQKITRRTKSIWHPKLTRGINSNKRYVDES